MKRTIFLSACLALAACATQPVDTAESGFGTLSVALTGALPDVQSLRLRLFDAPPASGGKVAFEAKCQPYTAQNILTVSPLKVASSYALQLDLFQDAACTKTRFRAYRGAIAVSAQSEVASQARPYYLQPYELGRFTGLAQVSAAKQIEAGKRSCSQDGDCKSVHPNATCALKQNVCVIDHMFPLDGAARRAFPLVVTLDDGRVAVGGGLTLQGTDSWVATNDRLEVFDPGTGLFQSDELLNVPPAVGLAEGVTLAGGSFAQVTGTSSARVTFDQGKSLTTALDTKGCTAGTTSSCKVSNLVARMDVKLDAAQQASLTSPLAFPIVARVKTPLGDRVLVAGGAKVPLPLGGDARTGQAVLCKLDGSTPDCSQATAQPMQAGRARAAVACVAGGNACTKVLLLGGRKKVTLPLAEIYDATTDSFTAALPKGSVPDTLHGGQLLPLADGSWLLVGASKKALFLEDGDVSTGGDLPPLKVTVDTSATPPTLTFAPVTLGPGITDKDVQRVLASAVGLNDRSVLLIGGLDPTLQARADALLIGPDGTVTAKLDLSAPRFGAGAALLGGSGPLAGCVLLAGGFTLQNAILTPQNHAEVFCPGAP
jgi:hypothetical protein